MTFSSSLLSFSLSCKLFYQRVSQLSTLSISFKSRLIGFRPTETRLLTFYAVSRASYLKTKAKPTFSNLRGVFLTHLHVSGSTRRYVRRDPSSIRFCFSYPWMRIAIDVNRQALLIFVLPLATSSSSLESLHCYQCRYDNHFCRLDFNHRFHAIHAFITLEL